MAEGSASSGSDVDVLSAVNSLQEQLKEQQKVQVTILQQLSALQQGAISATYSTPGATGGLPYPPSASEVSGTRHSRFPNSNPSPFVDAACSGEARLDLQKVEVALHQFYESGLAVATQKSYSSGQKRFLEFCWRYNLLAIPPSEHTIMLFISQLGMEGLSLSSIKSYLSAVRNLLVLIMVIRMR